MPGPVSDSYDPEWGTGFNRDQIDTALEGVYRKVSRVLGDEPPIYILELVDAKLPERLNAVLTEKEWRLIRFALERARESL